MAIAAGVVVVALVVVLVAQAVNRQQNAEVPTTAPPPATSSTAPATGSTAPSSPVVVSACAQVDQAFPLQPRGCILVSPPNVQPGEKLPLVFVLHGFNTAPETERVNGHWDEAVVRDRFIAAFPQGDFNSWNAGGCCGLAKSGNIDDVGYLQTLLVGLRQKSDVDPTRIFMVGESNGGMMTYRFLCQHADELAGAASSEGTSVAGCEPNAKVRFIHVHGTADTTVPYNGGQSLISWVLGVTFTSVPYSVQQLAASEGCAAPTSTTAGSVTTQTWDQCGGGGPVQLVTLAGWGHAWPTGAYDATAQILSFFGIAS